MDSASDDDTTTAEAPQATSEVTSEVGDDGAEEEAEEDGATVIQNNNGVVGDGISSTLVITAAPTLDELAHLREMGREALCWQLSSAKPGNGVEQIRDQSSETYWQSDVPTPTQPHWIQVHFARRVAISHVCLHLDFNLDESYTPKKVKVEVGMTSQDLVSAVPPPHSEVEFTEPVGWCIIPLQAPPDPLDDYDDEDHIGGSSAADENHMGHHMMGGGTFWRNVVRAHLLRISILSMHQNGRDTHVRHVQIFGPRMMNVTNLLPALPVVEPATKRRYNDNNHHHDAMEGVVVGEEDAEDWTEQRRSLREDFAALRMKWFTSIR